MTIYPLFKTQLAKLIGLYGTDVFFGTLEQVLRDMHQDQQGCGSHAELLRLAANSIATTHQILTTELRALRELADSRN